MPIVVENLLKIIMIILIQNRLEKWRNQFSFINTVLANKNNHGPIIVWCRTEYKV